LTRCSCFDVPRNFFISPEFVCEDIGGARQADRGSQDFAALQQPMQQQLSSENLKMHGDKLFERTGIDWVFDSAIR
jgi:hypothetical protein